MISVVVPVRNEERSILPFYDRLSSVLRGINRPYEIIFVDDASSDRSFDLLTNLVETDQRLKTLRLRRNFGQTAALSAGLDEAQGNIIVTLGGGQQYEPEDIPTLLAKLEQGFDIASGWRTRCCTGVEPRRIPSRIANWLMAKASGVRLHDFNTTFKAYRSEILKDVNLYGDLHRFIPILATFYGARVAEVPVRYTPRPGDSLHHGVTGVLHVLFDLVTVKFLLGFFNRPMHFFGMVSLAGWLLGLAAFALAGAERLIGIPVVVKTTPLIVAGAIALVTGMIMFGIGLLGEIVVRTYFESQSRRIYAVRDVRQRKERKAKDLPVD